jgi:AraC family transcriptional regulator
VSVAVSHVRCHAPRSGCGDEEAVPATEVVLPRRGVFVVHRGRERVVADANTALVLRSGEPYRVSHPVDGGDECTVLAPDPETAEEALSGAAGHALVPPRMQLAARLLTGPAAEAPAPRPGTPLSIEPAALASDEAAVALLGDVAARLGSAVAAPPVSAARAAAVRELLAGDPARDWRLDDVARAVHCSPFHLARQFRRTTGETIWRYLVRLRLALALDRLAGGESDLARLAVELGFSHQSHFGARFRATFGSTPGEVRRIVTAGAAAVT